MPGRIVANFNMFILLNRLSIIIKIITIIIAEIPCCLSRAFCPSPCWCDGNNINCNDQKLTEIPKDLPLNTFYLNLNNNNLRVLDLDLLSQLPNLETLTLRENKINRIQSLGTKQLTRLKNLDLHGNCLRIVRNGPVLSRAPGLTNLDLSKNSLTDIEDLFQNLTGLIRLSLSDNFLTNFSRSVFKDTIHLEKLIIKNNKIRKLDFEVFRFMNRLSVLELRRNDISEVTGSSSKNSALKILDLSQCHLEDIPSNLPPSLKYLNIGTNRLTFIKKNSLKNYQNLENIVLDHNKIDSIEQSSFLALENLRELDLSDNFISDFPQFLPKSLRGINLNRNHITSLTFNSLSRLPYLISLSLKYNKISGFLQRPFRSLRSLQYLYLDGNPLKVASKKDFLNQWNLQLLSLNECPLEQIEFQFFLKLKSLKELQLAFLTNRNLRFNGAVLKELPHLEKLNLQGSPSLISSVVTAQNILASFKDKLKVINLMNGHLRTIPNYFKKYLKNVHKIKLAGNPFHCDSHLRWLRDWIKEEPDKFPQRDLITCLTPENVRQTRIDNLNESSFQSLSFLADQPLTDTNQNFEKKGSNEFSQEIIPDLDYGDDLINYPVSGPQTDKNCPREYDDQAEAVTPIKTEMLKYTTATRAQIIDISSPEDFTRSYTTRSLCEDCATIFETEGSSCEDCATKVNMGNDQEGELQKKLLTTQINEKKREQEIRDPNRDSELSDSFSSVTQMNKRLTEQIDLLDISSVKAGPDKNNLVSSDGNNEISSHIVSIIPLIHTGRPNDRNQRATSQDRVKSLRGKHNKESTQSPMSENGKSVEEDLFNKMDNNKNLIPDIDLPQEEIPTIVRRSNLPNYLKMAAIIASIGAGVLALSTCLLVFLVRRFYKKKKKQQRFLNPSSGNS